MRITLFIGGLSGGGAERVTCNLANYLATKNHQVEILTVSDEPSTYALSNDVTRWTLGVTFLKGTPIQSAIRIVRLGWYLLTRKPDAYVVMLPRTTFMLLAGKWLARAKIIAAQRIMPASISKPGIKKKLREVAHKADAWVFQTQEQRDWFQGTTGEARLIVIPNAINEEFIRPIYSGVRRKRIIASGRFTNQKNHRLLLETFARIAKNFPDYTLTIYGEGPLRAELEQCIEKLCIRDKVSLPGYVTNIGEELKDASLYVLSSDYEGMPNALMEAMALGVPCVSTDCDGGGARFLIKNEKNGLLAPKGDVEALAAAMERMLGDSDFAERCGQEARKICERLAPKKVYGEWEQFIESVVNA